MIFLFSGIVAGPLIQRFGWRPVTICGSILSAIGFFSSSFANNVYLMYFTYGGLTGKLTEITLKKNVTDFNVTIRSKGVTQGS